jgi:6-phosphofructokinase 1
MERVMDIPRLGPCRFPSPLTSGNFVPEGNRVLLSNNEVELRTQIAQSQRLASYELAGPREQLYFDPGTVTAAIVSCGGLCPGINDVIRAIFMELWQDYGVRRILGLRYGYEGLNPACGHRPLALDFDEVDDIHKQGGSILATSRGPQDPATMVDFLVAEGIDMIFPIGGDGTQRGALALHKEITRRGLPIAVVGIPKSIDNDISCIDRTFGFETAVSEARDAISCAHVEARGAPNGVGLVKLMGRHSGFIAAWASLAYSEVNLCLVPEVPAPLGGVLDYLMDRLARRGHAVVVVAEGAGQQYFANSATGHDASGNAALQDIGLFLKDAIRARAEATGCQVGIKYIDPSYMIRGVPANAGDSVLCLRLGQCAAHAAMAGATGMLLGTWHGQFTHVPLCQAITKRRQLDRDGWVWQSVLHATGQPDW